MKAVSDATPLMHLAKIGKIYSLKKLFDKIIVPKEIYEEVIVKGKELGKNEVVLIENLIKEKYIIIKEIKSKIEIPNLHEGEGKALALCKELKIKNLLIDEKEGFNTAIMFNLIPIRTTSILIILLDKKIINFNEYKKSLRELSESGYFLDAATYERLINVGGGLRK